VAVGSGVAGNAVAGPAAGPDVVVGGWPVILIRRPGQSGTGVIRRAGTCAVSGDASGPFGSPRHQAVFGPGAGHGRGVPGSGRAVTGSVEPSAVEPSAVEPVSGACASPAGWDGADGTGAESVTTPLHYGCPG
jgi:hypothetical protein